MLWQLSSVCILTGEQKLRRARAIFFRSQFAWCRSPLILYLHEDLSAEAFFILRQKPRLDNSDHFLP
eukprot:s3440_g3.t1